MPGRTVRIAITPPPKPLPDLKGLIIEPRMIDGGCLIGIVNRISGHDYSIEVLASDRVPPVFITIPIKSPYKNIDREDLPLYVGLKYVSPRLEAMLRGDE
jgi:hypothetical protein